MRLTKFSQVMIVSIFGLVTMAAQAQSTGVVAKVNGVEIGNGGNIEISK